MREATIVDSGVAVLGTIMCYIFGELNGLLTGLIVLVVLDQVSGVLAAGIKGELSSEVGFNGIRRKVMIFMLVGMAHILDREVLSEFIGNSDVLRDVVIFFYLANEGLSIVENALEMGLPIPGVVKEKLTEIMWKGGDKNDARELDK